MEHIQFVSGKVFLFLPIKKMFLQHIKCVTVGDGTVGKTCLLISFAKKIFPSEYIPTVFDNYAVTIDSSSIILDLWDTAGQEEYDKLRPLSYSNTDIFIIAFSIVNPISYENIPSKWYPEITHYSPNTPYVLVGTKKDLLDDAKTILALENRNQKPILLEQALALNRDISSIKYFECSALTGEGVDYLFESVVSIASKHKFASAEKRHRKPCILL